MRRDRIFSFGDGTLRERFPDGLGPSIDLRVPKNLLFARDNPNAINVIRKANPEYAQEVIRDISEAENILREDRRLAAEYEKNFNLVNQVNEQLEDITRDGFTLVGDGYYLGQDDPTLENIKRHMEQNNRDGIGFYDVDREAAELVDLINRAENQWNNAPEPPTLRFKQRLRKAGDVVTDDLLNEIKALGAKQDADEEFTEQMRQLGIAEQMHGSKELAAFLDPSNPSRTTEQQIGRQLVMEGTFPDYIPADRILGTNVSVAQSGIDGAFKPDSEVRRHVTGQMNLAPADGDIEAAELLDLDRSDVRTELLSPTSRRQVYDAWKAPIDKANEERTKKRSTDRTTFNQAVSEYYGQQALRLKGAKPVVDSKRSYAIRNTDDPNSTKGTDRLIENSARLTLPDVRESADFRYMQDGNLVVGDNQTAPIYSDDRINFNVLKNSKLGDMSEDELMSKLVDAAQKTKVRMGSTNLDLVFNELLKDGTLGPLTTGYNSGGKTRAGKLLSSAPIMGQKNRDSQHRYDKILYAQSPYRHIGKDEGYLPTTFRQFDTGKMRNKIADELVKGGDNLELMLDPRSGRLEMGVYVPQGKSGGFLGDDNLNRQFSEGYSF